MRATGIVLVSVVVGLGAGPLAAQTVNPPTEVQFTKKGLDPKQARQMYEDVAVFRALLNRAIERSYGFPVQGAFHQNRGTKDRFHQSPLAEGVYLRGQGVIYNLSAPLPTHGPLSKEAGRTTGELSAWEQARRELRGEKLIVRAKTASQRPALSETLLRLLAENGRHFKQLGDNERITVAVAFRGSLDCTICHQVSAKGTGSFIGQSTVGMASNFLSRTGQPVRVGTSSNRPQSGSAQVYSGGSGSPQLLSNTSRNNIVVGDLHMRQNRYKAAARAYQEALTIHLRSMGSPPATHADVQKLLVGVELASKLAQAARAMGDKEAVQRIEGLSLKFAAAAVELADWLKGKPVRGKALALPSRLIVSAPKKLLDQAGAGKITFAEFRKAATVEHLRFPKAEK